MEEDFTKAPWVKAPDVAAAFERARKGSERGLKKPEAKLELRPPGPAPMGEQRSERLVSPQLREKDPREAEKRALMAKMLVRRQFNRAGRDPWAR